MKRFGAVDFHRSEHGYHSENRLYGDVDRERHIESKLGGCEARDEVKPEDECTT